MNMKRITILLLALVTLINAEIEYKKVTVLSREYVGVAVVEFDDVLHVKCGEIDSGTLDSYPFLRVLQNEWLLLLNDFDLSLETYLSYCYVEDEGHKQELTEGYERALEKFKTADDVLGTQYAKYFSNTYVKGAVFYKIGDLEYCNLDFGFTEDYGDDQISNKIAVKQDGLWKLYRGELDILSFSKQPLGSIAKIQKAMATGNLLYLEGGSVMVPVTVEEESYTRPDHE